MPTKPVEGLLYREMSKAEARELINVVRPLLEEIVNFSVNAWVRCEPTVSDEPDVNTAPLSLHLHLIEMTDGIGALMAECCSIPTVLQLRSSLEALPGKLSQLQNSQIFVVQR